MKHEVLRADRADFAVVDRYGSVALRTERLHRGLSRSFRES
jgi:hypothetical protein